MPDPAGRGVICELPEPHAKVWMVPGEPPVALDVWASNSHVVCWVGDRALFDEWSEAGPRYSLIDVATGESPWRTPAPKDLMRRYEIAAGQEDWVFVYDLEISRRRERDIGRHKIAVLNAADGDTLHVWRSSDSSPPPEAGRILHIDDVVYFVTRSDFARLDREDVLAGRYGWKPARQPEEVPDRAAAEVLEEEVELQINSGLRVWISDEGSIGWTWSTENPTTIRVRRRQGFGLFARHTIHYAHGDSELQEGGKVITGSVWQEGTGGHFLPGPASGEGVVVRSDVIVVEAESPDQLTGTTIRGNHRVLWEGQLEGRWP